MSIQTIKRPQQRTPPIVKSAEKPPSFYGWRYLTKTLPGGQTIEYQVALTAEDLLHPQEDDQVPQRIIHAQCSIDIFDMLKNHYHDDPTAGVFYDLIIEWGIPNLAEPSPDIVVIPNLKKKIDPHVGRFKVKEEGTRPNLVIEIVSPSTGSSDYRDKVDIYEQAGVKEYILIDPHSKRANPYFEIKGYRLDGQRYRLVKPDETGCLLSETTQVWFCLVDNAQGIQLKDAKTGRWLLNASGEHEARIEAEADAKQANIRAEKEMKARQQAEIKAKEAEIKAKQETKARQEEQKARQQAETRAEQEAKARKKAQEEKELAQQQVAQLMEKLRQQGIDPKEI
jgi:Uma2 family endonuclease